MGFCFEGIRREVATGHRHLFIGMWHDEFGLFGQVAQNKVWFTGLPVVLEFFGFGWMFDSMYFCIFLSVTTPMQSIIDPLQALFALLRGGQRRDGSGGRGLVFLSH